MPAPRQDIPAPSGLLNMFPYAEHPWNAQKFVADIERRNLGVTKWLEDCEWGGVPASFEYGKRTTDPFPAYADQRIQHHLFMTAQEATAHTLWERGGRTVLDIHPGMIPYLRASGSDKFPPMVLRHLPYTNPLVFLGSPVDLADPAGKPCRLIGWYMLGVVNRQFLDTTDERATAFHLVAISEVLTDDRKEVFDWDFSRLTLPISGDDATMDEIIERGLANFTWDPMMMNQKVNLQRQFITGILTTIVPHLLYLVSQNLESKPKPFHSPAPPRQHKWDRKAGGGKVNRQLVGWNSGPTLASLDHWGDDAVEPRGATGEHGPKRSPRPHMRRAHFHTYRVGEGRRDRRVKWLAPIPINASGPATGTTAVKVR